MKNLMKKFFEGIKNYFKEEDNNIEEIDKNDPELLRIHNQLQTSVTIQDMSMRIASLVDCKQTAMHWLDRSKDSPIRFFILKKIEEIDNNLELALVDYNNQVLKEAQLLHVQLQIVELKQQGII